MNFILILAFVSLCFGQDIDKNELQGYLDLLEKEEIQANLGIKRALVGRGSHFEAAYKNVTVQNSVAVASILEYPGDVHLCSASFIRHDVLITTAKCIYGKVKEKLFVHCNSRNLLVHGKRVRIRNIVPHQKFELIPSTNDVGLVLLEKSVSSATVLKLPEFWLNLYGRATYYMWKFSPEIKSFHLHSDAADLISNIKCTLILKEYIDCKNLCIAKRNIVHGSLDEGVPLIGMYNNEPYILGILNVNRESESVNADVYERVDHFVPWIVKTLNSPQFSNLKRPKQYIQRQENTTDEQ